MLIEQTVKGLSTVKRHKYSLREAKIRPQKVTGLLELPPEMPLLVYVLCLKKETTYKYVVGDIEGGGYHEDNFRKMLYRGRIDRKSVV